MSEEIVKISNNVYINCTKFNDLFVLYDFKLTVYNKEYCYKKPLKTDYKLNKFQDFLTNLYKLNNVDSIFTKHNDLIYFESMYYIIIKEKLQYLFYFINFIGNKFIVNYMEDEFDFNHSTIYEYDKIKHRNIEEKDWIIMHKDNDLRHKDAVIEQKDDDLRHKDAVIEQKDDDLRKKDVIINELTMKLIGK